MTTRTNNDPNGITEINRDLAGLVLVLCLVLGFLLLGRATRLDARRGSCKTAFDANTVPGHGYH
ncbi:hypothetical protein N7490_004076 [Penicillium lividum]|nr:hypothetical protein N7490_004076 [Penicillium lividum]